jgi:hypothetical protein
VTADSIAANGQAVFVIVVLAIVVSAIVLVLLASLLMGDIEQEVVEEMGRFGRETDG